MRTWSDVRGRIESITDEEKNEIKIIANLINQIIDRREELGLTQRQLAARSGIKQAAIARLESLNVVPRIDTLVRLSKPLGLEVRLVATTARHD